jgi:hypothetical protein
VKGVTGQFVDVGIEEAVRLAKAAADGGDVGVLGANVARQSLEAGLLDEIIVHVAPVLVGDGEVGHVYPAGRRADPPFRQVSGCSTAGFLDHMDCRSVRPER